VFSHKKDISRYLLILDHGAPDRSHALPMPNFSNF